MAYIRATILNLVVLVSMVAEATATVEELAQPPANPIRNLQGATVALIALATLFIAAVLVMQFREMDAKARLTLFICIPGIVIPLIAYSYEQERVMQTAYIHLETGSQEYFAKSWTPILVMFNRLGAAIFAFLMLLYTGESMGRRAPMLNYGMVALSNVIATLCQYTALKYISFQMQSLSKCSKIMWVMGWGYIMSGKRHSWDDYMTAIIVTLGAFVFGFSGDIETGYDAANGTGAKWGVLLMLGYLVADGLTSNLQEKIFRGYRITHNNQMLYVNLLSSGLAFSLVMVRGNQLPEFIEFVKRHPGCMYDIGLLVFSQITAQNFIYLMIKNFGALLLATIMYSRQLLSIIFNTLWFEDPMTPMQWVAVVVVFGALFSKSKFMRRVFCPNSTKPKNQAKHDIEMQPNVDKKLHALEGESVGSLPMKRAASQTTVDTNMTKV